jgi:DNA uptake protein ComE-like DNA-binding protein
MLSGRKSFFYWNKRERRGSVALMALLAVAVFVYYRLKLKPDESWQPDEEFLARAAQFQDAYDAENRGNFASRSYPENSRTGKRKFHPPAAPFDPNGLPKEEWIRLGLSPAQAESVKKFEARGGRFYKNEDLKKLYVISDDFYRQIEPYLAIPQFGSGKPQPAFSAGRQEVAEKIDINQADSAALDNLPGISPKLASRIIRVRENLGGLVSLSQLNDMPGFFADSYQKLTEKAFVGPAEIKPLNLNYCTFKELLLVPGLDYERVKAIITHRERNGFFRQTEDLVTLNLAEPDLYIKIAPYLTIR